MGTHEEALARVQELEELLVTARADADGAEQELAEAIAERTRLEVEVNTVPVMTERERHQRERRTAMNAVAWVVLLVIATVTLVVGVLVYASRGNR